jgi:hypothetical protein
MRHDRDIPGQFFRCSASNDLDIPPLGKEQACRDVAIPAITTRPAQHDDPPKRVDLLNKPRGSLYDMTLRWSGEWPQPEQYTLKSRFLNLGVNAVGRLPGLQNVSGQIDCNEKGGTLALNTQNSTVELPRLFAQSLAFDMLNAQAGWQLNGSQYEVKLNTVAFSNPGVTGTVSDSYQVGTEGRGMADIAASLSRVDARSVLPYLPLQMPEEPRQWLEASLLGGTSKDVKVRLRGNLNDFPFPEGRLVLEGLQHLTAAAPGGPTVVGGHRHQHDRLARRQPPDPMVHQHGGHPVAGGTGVGELRQAAFGHTGIVVQLQGLHGCARGGVWAHPTDEMAGGGGETAGGGGHLPLPDGQHLQGLKGGGVQLQIQRGRGKGVHGQPPLIGGRKASSSPSRSGVWGLAKVWLIATRTVTGSSWPPS